MRIGMIGLGRMGGNMARRLLKAGVEVVGYSRSGKESQALAGFGGAVASSPAELLSKLPAPRAIWPRRTAYRINLSCCHVVVPMPAQRHRRAAVTPRSRSRFQPATHTRSTRWPELPISRLASTS